MKSDQKAKFIHCPRCSSVNISQTDYEELNDEGEPEIVEEGRSCDDCGWEGDVSELVCKDEIA
jgi:hypothetical protein